MRDHRSIPPVPARGGPVLIRVVAVVAMLFGTVTVGLQGAAGQDETFAYDEDGVAWSVDYDSSVWTESSSDVADLFLTSENGSVGQFLTVPQSEGITPDDCLARVIPEFEGGANATEAETIGDGDGDGYTYEERTLTGEAQGTEITGEAVHVCYDLGGDRVLWGVVFSPEVDGDLVDEPDVVYGLVGAVSVDGEPVPVDFGASVDAATGEATPEGTPTSGSGDAPTYESPSFGYTFSYDETVWTYQVELQNGADGGRDGLQISAFDGDYALYIEGSEEWSDPDDCLATLATEIGSETSVIAEDADGEPIETSTDDEASAAYPQDGVVAYIACYAAPEGDLVVGFTALVTGDEDTFVSDALPAIEVITGSLEFAS